MDFIIDFFKVVFLGIVQGITEWLPISSTGHLMLFESIFILPKENILTEDFMTMFRVVIQFGSILAVVAVFFRKLNPFDAKKDQMQKNETWTMWIKVVISCLPAAILGFLLDDWLDNNIFNEDNKIIAISIALIVYGFLFIFIENYKNGKGYKIGTIAELSYMTAFMIGLCQVLALVPGTSRSGATILGAIILGCSRKTAAEFSFFLAIPVMAGASFLKIVKAPAFGSIQIIMLFIGTAVAFVVSVFAVKFLMNFVRKHDFKPFGYYRIVIGLIILAAFALNR